jgi:hypothetical protein
MCAVAVALRVDGGSIAEARVGLTNMGTTPIRASGVEQALLGQPASADVAKAAAERATEGTAAPSDADAAADYREHLPGCSPVARCSPPPADTRVAQRTSAPVTGRASAPFRQENPMQLENKFTIEAPIEKAWEALNTPQTWRPASPGPP